jgi:hypothetical protein
VCVCLYGTRSWSRQLTHSIFSIFLSLHRWFLSGPSFEPCGCFLRVRFSGRLKVTRSTSTCTISFSPTLLPSRALLYSLSLSLSISLPLSLSFSLSLSLSFASARALILSSTLLFSCRPKSQTSFWSNFQNNLSEECM